MTVMVTMAGLGSRFRNADYQLPKYRITARGRTLMYWSLKSMQAFFDERFVFACLEEEDTNWILSAAQELGIADVVIALRPAISRGQAETAFDALIHVNPNEPLWIYNIDTHVTPLTMRPSDLSGADGCLHVFHSTEPNMSFVRYDERGKVVEIAEKLPVSNWASVGLYGFRTATSFDSLYREGYIEGRLPTINGEHYVAPIYGLMLEHGCRIIAPRLRSEDVHILGTPVQVQIFDPTALPPYGSRLAD